MRRKAMETNLPLKTYDVQFVDEQIIWPKEITKDSYTLIYTHSHLLLNQSLPQLNRHTLYEAWAFNGKKSWHIWKRDNAWVCTVYDAENDDDVMIIQREQLLLPHFAKTINKQKLIIQERLAFDTDDQAFIAYACPIELRD